MKPEGRKGGRWNLEEEEEKEEEGEEGEEDSSFSRRPHFPTQSAVKIPLSPPPPNANATLEPRRRGGNFTARL